MSANPTIELTLVRSSDMSTIIGLDAATSRSFSPVFNQPGTFSISLPIDSKAAFYVKKWSTAMTFARNDKIVWSGPCTSIVRAAKAGTVTCTFNGWLIELAFRFVWAIEEATLNFPSPGTVGGSILQTLISTANAKIDTDGLVRPTHLGFGSIGDSQARIRSYKRGNKYLDLVNELISIEDGFDVGVDPLTRLVSTRDPAAFAVRDDVKWGWGEGTSGNLEDAVETDDGIAMANRENVAGASGGVISVDDGAAIDDAGIMLEDWLSLSDVSDPTIIGAYANSELVYKRYGTQTFQITPKQFGDLPRPYDDWDFGDKAALDVNRDSFQVDGLGVRMFSAQIAYDDNGNEIINEIGLTAS